MKTFALKYLNLNIRQLAEYLCLATILVLSWKAVPSILLRIDPTAALIDPGIWQLCLLSLILFSCWLILSWQLLRHFWHRLGFAGLNNMVSQFNTLALWQQLGFYWASFALLLLAGIACLNAVL